MVIDEPNPEEFDSERGKLIAELAEQHLNNLFLGKGNLQKLVDENPDLAPELEQRLRFVEKLFSVSRSDDLIDNQLTRDDDSLDEQGTADFQQLPLLPNQRVIRIDCPHCGIKLQLVDELDHGEITCNGCGSTIEIDSNETRSQTRQVGRHLDRFEIESVLGQGGFGSVYKAMDPKLGRMVALKIPRLGYFSSQNQSAKFLREARNAARLRHPNIVQVHEIVEEGSFPVIVTEYIEGLTLSDLISSRRIDIRECAKLVSTIAEAIEYAHTQGVIHRDIKPSNILLDADRKPYVADFGLAHDSHADVTMTLDGEILGTPAYMSPEQARGDNSTVGNCSDVYSLGVVLYQMLSGMLPFRGSKRMLLHQVINEDPQPIRRLNEKVPHDLEVIAGKAMQKDPKRRYESAQAMADDLNRWLRFEPIKARPDGIVNRFAKWTRRKPMVATLSISLVLLLIAGTVLTAIWAQRESGFNTQIRSNLNVSNSRLDQIYLQNGISLLESGQHISSLLWFEQLLKGPQPDVEQTHAKRDGLELNRLRINMTIDQCPTLTNLWSIGDEVMYAEYSSDGGSILAVNRQNVVTIIDAIKSETKRKFVHSDDIQNASFDKSGNLILVSSGNRAFLWDVKSGERVAQLGHKDIVMYAEFSSDAKKIVTASLDGTVKLWDASNGNLIHTLDHPIREVRLAKFSSDAKRLATVTNDETFENSEIRIWNVEKGEIEKTLLHHGRVYQVAFDVGGTRLISAGNDRTAKIWNLDTGEVIGEPIQQRDAIIQIRIDSVGASFYLVTSDGTISHWELATGRSIGIEIRQDVAISRAELSPDLRITASTSVDGNVRLHWVDSGSLVCGSLPHGTTVSAIAFHPEGHKFVAGGNDGALKEWDLAGLAPKIPDLLHGDGILDASFSSLDDRILTCSFDATGRLWNSQTGQPVGQPMAHDQVVLECAFGDNDRYAVTVSGDKTARVWDGLTGMPIGQPHVHSDVVLRVATNPRADTFVTGTKSGVVMGWQFDSNKSLFSVNHGKDIYYIAFNAIGDKFASASLDGSVRIWNSSDGESVGPPLQHDGPVTFCEFDPTGKFLATSGGTHQAVIWALDDLTKPWQILSHKDDVNTCTFSQDGMSLVTTDYQGNVTVWERQSGKFLPRWKNEFGNYSLMFGTFSPDGKKVVVCGKKLSGDDRKPGNGVIFVLDAITGTALSPPLLHMGLVRRARFSHNGKFIVSASLDHTARIWPIETESVDRQTLSLWIAVLTGKTINEKMQRVILAADEQHTRFVTLQKLQPELLHCSADEIDRWTKYVELVVAATIDAKTETKAEMKIGTDN